MVLDMGKNVYYSNHCSRNCLFFNRWIACVKCQEQVGIFDVQSLGDAKDRGEGGIALPTLNLPEIGATELGGFCQGV